MKDIEDNWNLNEHGKVSYLGKGPMYTAQPQPEPAPTLSKLGIHFLKLLWGLLVLTLEVGLISWAIVNLSTEVGNFTGLGQIWGSIIAYIFFALVAAPWLRLRGRKGRAG